MAINMNPINPSALAAYAGNRIGNLGLSFGKVGPINFPMLQPNKNQGDFMSGLGSALQSIGDRRAQQGQQDKAFALKQQQMAQQAAESEKQRFAMMELSKMKERAQTQRVQMGIDAKLKEAAAQKAEEQSSEQIKKRAAFGLTYLNSPEIMNDEKNSNSYFDIGLKKKIINEDEYNGLINSDPKSRATIIKADLVASTGALDIKAMNKQLYGATKEKLLSPQQAGYSAGVKPGYKDIQMAKGIFLNEDGTKNTKNVWGSQSDPLGLIQGFPFSKGREGRQALERALTTKLRLESGAAVPDTEVERYMNMFAPSPGDSVEAIKSKFKQLEAWYENVNSKITPNMSPEKRLEVMYKLATDKPSSSSTVPEGVSEEDIQYTMQKHNLTREQVLERLRSR